ncbi:MAG: DUF2203 domain-containing protein [Gemmatimonadaceae bacterium]|nr:DUF2203 domain-containing protein [Gemmatimonadaceae bacterium]
MQQLYTVGHANATLPLVRRIVEDIVVNHQRWRERVLEFDLLASSVRADAPDDRATQLERQAQALARDIDAFERELAALGIALKDRRLGLIDFPAMLDGREVWLCWRLGEPDIRFYHELDAGFGGRKPLAAPVEYQSPTHP